MLDDIETVTPGEGMPCTVCFITHVTSTTPLGEPPTDDSASASQQLAAGGAAYREWGWPVTVHRDQTRLSLHHEVSALTIPVLLGTEVTKILARRGCAPAVLAHPDTPERHTLLTGERYGVTLPWPHQVHQVTGLLLLPPTMTPRGPITWIRRPQEDSLRLCREIDLFGALRTALNSSPPPRTNTAPERDMDAYRCSEGISDSDMDAYRDSGDAW